MNSNQDEPRKDESLINLFKQAVTDEKGQTGVLSKEINGVPVPVIIGVSLLVVLGAVYFFTAPSNQVGLTVEVSSAGELVKDAEVAAFMEGSELTSGKTQADGSVGLSVPKEEEITVKVNKEGCSEFEKQLKLEKERSFRVSLTCRKTGEQKACLDELANKIRKAQLVGEQGEQVNGCQVRVLDENGNPTDTSFRISRTQEIWFSGAQCPQKNQQVQITCEEHRFEGSMDRLMTESNDDREVELTKTQTQTTIESSAPTSTTEPPEADTTYETYVSVKKESGDPLTTAKVYAAGENGEKLGFDYRNVKVEATTGSGGTATIILPEETEYYIHVEDMQNVHRPFLTNNNYIALSTRDVTVNMKEGFKTNIKVKNPRENGPIPNAGLKLKQDGELLKTGITDSDGNAKFVLAKENYDVHIIKHGFIPQSTSVTGETDTAIDMPPLDEENSGLVTAEVVNEKGIGESLENISLKLQNSEGVEFKSCTSQEDGSCDLGRVQAGGPYEVIYDGTSMASITVEAGKNTEKEVNIIPPQLTLTVPTKVEGARANEVTVEVWDVTYTPNDPYKLGEKTSDRRGQVEFTVTKGNKIYLRAKATKNNQEYRLVTTTFTMENDEEYSVNLRELEKDFDMEIVNEQGQGVNSLAQGGKYTAEVALEVPYYDPQTREKFTKINFRMWTGDQGTVSEIDTTPIIIRNLDRRNFLRENPEVGNVRTSNQFLFNGRTPPSNLLSSASKYFELDLNNNYDRPTVYQMEIPLGVRYKTGGDTARINYKAEWKKDGTTVLSTGETWQTKTYPISGNQPSELWETENDNFYLYNIWLSSDKQGENELEKPISEAGTFYTQFRGVARKSTNDYPIPISVQSQGDLIDLSINSYSGSIEEAGNQIKKIYEITDTDNDLVNPPADATNGREQYSINSDQLVSLHVQMSAEIKGNLVGTQTVPGEINVLNDQNYDHKHLFEVIEVSEDQKTPVSNLIGKVVTASQFSSAGRIYDHTEETVPSMKLDNIAKGRQFATIMKLENRGQTKKDLELYMRDEHGENGDYWAKFYDMNLPIKIEKPTADQIITKDTEVLIEGTSVKDISNFTIESTNTNGMTPINNYIYFNETKKFYALYSPSETGNYTVHASTSVNGTRFKDTQEFKVHDFPSVEINNMETTAEDGEIAVGEPVKTTATVTNNGNKPAKYTNIKTGNRNTRIGPYLTLSIPIQGKTWKNATLGTIPEGGTKTVEFSWTPTTPPATEVTAETGFMEEKGTKMTTLEEHDNSMEELTVHAATNKTFPDIGVTDLDYSDEVWEGNSTKIKFNAMNFEPPARKAYFSDPDYGESEESSYGNFEEKKAGAGLMDWLSNTDKAYRSTIIFDTTKNAIPDRVSGGPLYNYMRAGLRVAWKGERPVYVTNSSGSKFVYNGTNGGAWVPADSCSLSEDDCKDWINATGWTNSLSTDEYGGFYKTTGNVTELAEKGRKFNSHSTGWKAKNLVMKPGKIMNNSPEGNQRIRPETIQNIAADSSTSVNFRTPKLESNQSYWICTLYHKNGEYRGDYSSSNNCEEIEIDVRPLPLLGKIRSLEQHEASGDWVIGGTQGAGTTVEGYNIEKMLQQQKYNQATDRLMEVNWTQALGEPETKLMHQNITVKPGEKEFVIAMAKGDSTSLTQENSEMETYLFEERNYPGPGEPNKWSQATYDHGLVDFDTQLQALDKNLNLANVNEQENSIDMSANLIAVKVIRYSAGNTDEGTALGPEENGIPSQKVILSGKGIDDEEKNAYFDYENMIEGNAFIAENMNLNPGKNFKVTARSPRFGEMNTAYFVGGVDLEIQLSKIDDFNFTEGINNHGTFEQSERINITNYWNHEINVSTLEFMDYWVKKYYGTSPRVTEIYESNGDPTCTQSMECEGLPIPGNEGYATIEVDGSAGSTCRGTRTSWLHAKVGGEEEKESVTFACPGTIPAGEVAFGKPIARETTAPEDIERRAGKTPCEIATGEGKNATNITRLCDAQQLAMAIADDAESSSEGTSYTYAFGGDSLITAGANEVYVEADKVYDGNTPTGFIERTEISQSNPSTRQIVMPTDTHITCGIVEVEYTQKNRDAYVNYTVQSISDWCDKDVGYAYGMAALNYDKGLRPDSGYGRYFAFKNKNSEQKFLNTLEEVIRKRKVNGTPEFQDPMLEDFFSYAETNISYVGNNTSSIEGKTVAGTGLRHYYELDYEDFQKGEAGAVDKIDYASPKEADPVLGYYNVRELTSGRVIETGLIYDNAEVTEENLGIHRQELIKNLAEFWLYNKSSFTGNEKQTTDFSTITARQPTADAGKDQSVGTGETIDLNGSDSYDLKGGVIDSYNWTITNMSKIEAEEYTGDLDNAQLRYASDASEGFYLDLPEGNNSTYALDINGSLNVTVRGRRKGNNNVHLDILIDGEEKASTEIDSNSWGVKEAGEIKIEDSGSHNLTIKTDNRVRIDWIKFSGATIKTIEDEERPSFSIGTAGTYQAELTVADNDGLKDTDTATIYVSEQPGKLNMTKATKDSLSGATNVDVEIENTGSRAKTGVISFYHVPTNDLSNNCRRIQAGYTPHTPESTGNISGGTIATKEIQTTHPIDPNKKLVAVLSGTGTYNNLSCDKHIKTTGTLTAIASSDKDTAIEGEDITFSGSGSYDDPNGNIVLYEWDFGDSSPTETGVVAPHSYSLPRPYAVTYTVTLTVTDDEGNTATDTLPVEIIPGGGSTREIIDEWNFDTQGITSDWDAHGSAYRNLMSGNPVTWCQDLPAGDGQYMQIGGSSQSTASVSNTMHLSGYKDVNIEFRLAFSLAGTDKHAEVVWEGSSGLDTLIGFQGGTDCPERTRNWQTYTYDLGKGEATNELIFELENAGGDYDYLYVDNIIISGIPD